MRTTITAGFLAMLAPVAHRQLTDHPLLDQPVSHLLRKEMNIEECLTMSDDMLPKYHQDTACDRPNQNLIRANLGRYESYKRIKDVGQARIPNEKTVHCPTTVHALRNELMIDGFDGIWLFENTASRPVVVAFVNHAGMEVSALDPSIAPPHKDPRAILQPGQWKSLFSYQGHVFHVRELLDDGTMGNVLLQHRIGLIPVTNKYGPAIACDPNEPDLEPLENGKIHPDFARTPGHFNLRCNVMDIGFRNMVGCPLHGYYTGLSQVNTTSGQPSCMEMFKFHLGMNAQADDFFFDWDSRVKYEGTFTQHNYVFRLAKDPSILIDHITVEPTLIRDCPNLKQKQYIPNGMELTPLGTLQNLKVDNHSNNTTTTIITTTTTSEIPITLQNTTATTTTPPSLHINGTSSNLAHFTMGSF